MSKWYRSINHQRLTKFYQHALLALFLSFFAYNEVGILSWWTLPSTNGRCSGLAGVREMLLGWICLSRNKSSQLIRVCMLTSNYRFCWWLHGIHSRYGFIITIWKLRSLTCYVVSAACVPNRWDDIPCVLWCTSNCEWSWRDTQLLFWHLSLHQYSIESHLVLKFTYCEWIQCCVPVCTPTKPRLLKLPW